MDKIETLIISESYNDFSTLYKNSKDTIYRKIVDTFESTKTSGKEKITLTVTGHIDGRPFDTNFIIEKSDPSLLMAVINPYFESIEDYETCERIVKLYSELKG